MIDELKTKCREYTELTGLTTTYTCEGWFRKGKIISLDEEEWDVCVFDESSRVVDRINETSLEEAIRWLDERIENGKSTD